MSQAQLRRTDNKVQWPQLLINEEHNQPWSEDLYRKRFRLVRAHAVAGIMGEGGKWITAPMPSLENLTDQDLRDTNQTWLANAGATDIEMAAVANHSESTIA
ncbi:MAG: hypothetical protein JKY99_11730 [Rhizobiales bacterium]|nr:hypothetical protein [Hyphomicrobiales bacterium]